MELGWVSKEGGKREVKVEDDNEDEKVMSQGRSSSHKSIEVGL